MLPVNVYLRIKPNEPLARTRTVLTAFGNAKIDGVASHDSKPLTKEDLLTEYRDIFTGTGMFEKEYHIELDPSVPPVIQTPRKVPYAKHTQLKETLDKLERDGIIASGSGMDRCEYALIQGH